ncbi:kelch-like protein 3 [Dendronephthya gigantea]|uniref:kelch-like protein 3 n=1 Tax=Dendronephthya gigantea TaxID=151771 RepID=UPI001069E444|nr:kelch-like protein 3 [Dendronephthya gigantea]
MSMIQCSTSKLLASLYESIAEMWESRQLCDVEIKGCDGRSIEAHRLVLSAISPYFRSMFTGDLCESRQKIVKIENVEGEILATLVRFAYLSKLEVNNTNVEGLLAASNLLQIKEVEKMCCDFLQGQLHPSNCLGIWALAELHHCRELSSFTFRFILKNFPSVSQSEEFCCLSLKDVKIFLNNPNLSINSEEMVFEAGIRWIESESKRELHLPEIVSCVRLGSLTPDYLRENILKSNLVRKSLLCCQIVENALEFTLSPLSEKQKITGITCNASRIADGYGDQLIAVGGLNGNDAINVVEKYNMYTDSWEVVSDMPTSRYGVAMAKLHGLVYCLGGCTSGIFLDICECYDIDLDSWQTIASMSRPRKYLGAAQSHNRIFAIGGTDGYTKQKSVENFDPNRNEWAPCASMGIPRMYVGTATIGGLVYAVGGHDGVKRLKSVECYDVVNDCWLPVRSMESERSVAGVTSMDNIMYCCGGFDGTSHLKDACMYDPRLDKWMEIADMSQARSSSCLAAMKGRLYVLGGFNGQFLQSVEMYDPRANLWELVADMTMTRVHFGASVV